MHGGKYSNERLRKKLEQILSSPDAIWTLCSLMLRWVPDSQLETSPNWLFEAISNHRMIHIEAYVVHVDLVQCQEIAFKLTPESISELIEYYKDVYLVNTAAACIVWSKGIEKLQDEFTKSVNRFVYRTSAKALLNLESNGSGELSFGKNDKAKTAIMGLFPSYSDIISILSSISPFDTIGASLSDPLSAAQIIQHISSPAPQNNWIISGSLFYAMAPTNTITCPQYGDGAILSSFGS